MHYPIWGVALGWIITILVFGAFIMFIKVKIDDLLGRNQNVHTSASSKINKKQQNTFKEPESNTSFIDGTLSVDKAIADALEPGAVLDYQIYSLQTTTRLTAWSVYNDLTDLIIHSREIHWELEHNENTVYPGESFSNVAGIQAKMKNYDVEIRVAGNRFIHIPLGQLKGITIDDIKNQIANDSILSKHAFDD